MSSVSEANFKDTHNFLTSCEHIGGEWRDPIYLNSSGFDPSLFHDEDGRKWLVNMLWDHRPGRTSFHGIVLQEFSVSEEQLIGEPELIFQGTELGITEAPHLYRHEAIGSQFTQALVARRFEHHAFYAETQLEFIPVSFQQMAGLTCYYNSTKFHYLFLSLDDAERPMLGIMSCEANSDLAATFPISTDPVRVREGHALRLGVKVRNEWLQFCWGYAGEALEDIGPALDASILSDETGKGEGAQFTGAFVGMCAQDSSGARRHADFSYFLYKPSD